MRAIVSAATVLAIMGQEDEKYASTHEKFRYQS
jgi:hypothetical protein